MFVILILHTLILRSGNNIAILPNPRLGYKIIIIIALVLPSMLQTTVNSYCDTHIHIHIHKPTILAHTFTCTIPKGTVFGPCRRAVRHTQTNTCIHTSMCMTRAYICVSVCACVYV